MDYTRNLVISIFLVLLFNTNKNVSDALNIYLFIHDFLQYNIAGIPLFHEKTQWDFDPEVGKQRRVKYEEENGHHGELAIAKLDCIIVTPRSAKYKISCSTFT